MSKRKQRGSLKWIFAGILLLLFFTVQPSTLPSASATDRDAVKEEDVQEDVLSHKEIVKLADQFMETLVQQADNNNKVLDYESKNDLLATFDDFAAKETASAYIDYYYEEQPDGLYIIPTATPPWFVKENDYDMVQLGKDKVKVTQENESAMYGTYTIIIEFTLNENQNWKISGITHE